MAHPAGRLALLVPFFVSVESTEEFGGTLQVLGRFPMHSARVSGWNRESERR